MEKKQAVRRRNKKGSLSDVAFIASSLLAISIIMLIGFKVSDSINTKIQDSDAIGKLSGATQARASIDQVNNMFPGVMDNSFLFITIGLAIVSLIFAMLVAVHPVFFFFYIVFLAILIFVSGAFSNIYQQVATNPEMLDVAEQLVFTSFVMNYLPFIIGVFGFLLAIVMYKTWQNRQ